MVMGVSVMVWPWSSDLPPAGGTLRVCLLLLFALALGGCSEGGQQQIMADAAPLDLHAAADLPAPDQQAPDAGATICHADPMWTVGLVKCQPGASPGYTLLAPLHATTTYLIDHHGRLIHSWPSAHEPGLSAHLMPNGDLLRTANDPDPAFDTGGTGGRLQIIRWDGTLRWDFPYNTTQTHQHHEAIPMPGGTVLFIAWESKSKREALAAGRDPSLIATEKLWLDMLVEVLPQGQHGGEVVWQWRLWDHLVQEVDQKKTNYGSITGHPELMDFNKVQDSGSDWTHFNSVAYNATLDQLMVSTPWLNEILVIDHSTSTAEASTHSGGKQGKGGDILYRWGNPENYGANTPPMRRLFAQHDASWIPPGHPGAGQILIFNNLAGLLIGGVYSEVVQVVPPVTATGAYSMVTGKAYGPEFPTWKYKGTPEEPLLSLAVSGAQRLPNGNTLVCDGGSGTIMEVTLGGEEVWRYINPVLSSRILPQGGSHLQQNNQLFRAPRYSADHPGLREKSLVPKGYLERPQNQ